MREFLPFPQFAFPLPGSFHSIVWRTELASDSQRSHVVGSYCTPCLQFSTIAPASWPFLKTSRFRHSSLGLWMKLSMQPFS